MRMRSQLKSAVRPMTTVLPYLWRTTQTNSLNKCEFMQKAKTLLIEHNELEVIWGADVGKDPSRIYYVHALSHWIENDRLSDILDRGITVVYQGSGYAGTQDGFYNYVLTGAGYDNKPYSAFRGSEVIHGLIDFFLEKNPSNTKVIFRSPNEVAEIKAHGLLNMAVFKRQKTTIRLLLLMSPSRGKKDPILCRLSQKKQPKVIYNNY